MNEKIIDYKSDHNLYNVKRPLNQKSMDMLFNNLIWLTTKEAAFYLRKSVNAVHTLVSRKKLRARKFSNRLYFKRDELDYLLETSNFIGG